MIAIPPDPLDDRLDAAIAALRRSPAPEGPSEATQARVLAALEAAEAGAKDTPHPRRKLMIAMLKLTAAAALLAAAASALLPSRPAMAFADLAEKLREARTLTFRTTTLVPGLKAEIVQKFSYKDPGRTRLEMPDALVVICDRASGKSLILNLKDRTANLSAPAPGAAKPTRKPSDDTAFEFIEMLRGARSKEVRPVEGRRKVGDVEALGFRIVENGQEFTVWADPRTKLPLLAETSIRVGDHDATISMSDFVIGPELDDSLFDLTPPPGYQVKESESQAFVPEDDAVALLRLYAAHHDGAFPDRIDNAIQYKSEWLPHTVEDGAVRFDPATTRLLGSIGRSTVFRFVIKGGFGYKADGVKLGDADKVVFWYRPEGSANYRAVFGDLRVGDVPADRLPEGPRP